ncbi:MAG: hypothetical protein WDW36_005970 [Sanguina aurantia]
MSRQANKRAHQLRSSGCELQQLGGGGDPQSVLSGQGLARLVTAPQQDPGWLAASLAHTAVSEGLAPTLMRSRGSRACLLTRTHA